MKIEIETINCSYTNGYLFDDINSSIKIKLEIENIVSVQSKKNTQEELIKQIKNELSQFTYLITGVVFVDFVWFIDAQKRQETDRFGDIDSITKPILDSLTGKDGVFIDDSQIKALYTFWSSKNHTISNNILLIEIKFLNDNIIDKENLYFIQYHNAMCTPINIDLRDLSSLFGLKVLLNVLKNRRKTGIEYLIVSNWDFHKTRLKSFRKQTININQVNKLCLENGLTFKKLKELRITKSR
jgi:Holliday junction resolvase RusA-like endonuclease